MILYTMTPYEHIFPPAEEEQTSEVMLSYNGIPIVAEWTENQEYRVVRVLSTNLNDFMDPVCKPGAKISLHSSK